ncbi:hypothetical protein [Brevundimonas sp.]|uniref:hypothetical protein n=1 Tax=Brevundimonas sp. TaxID=1871086 RepID=UPI0025CFDF68|nr:hypothetical protein [Brevundimonas sp.]
MLFDTDPADLDPEAFGYAHPDEEEHQADVARGYTSRIIVMATLFLAVTNAASLVSWASTLEPNWGGRTVRELSDAWAGQMSELGLDRYRVETERLWQAFADLPRERDIPATPPRPEGGPADALPPPEPGQAAPR